MIFQYVQCLDCKTKFFYPEQVSLNTTDISSSKEDRSSSEYRFRCSSCGYIFNCRLDLSNVNDDLNNHENHHENFQKQLHLRSIDIDDALNDTDRIFLKDAQNWAANLLDKVLKAILLLIVSLEVGFLLFGFGMNLVNKQISIDCLSNKFQTLIGGVKINWQNNINEKLNFKDKSIKNLNNISNLDESFESLSEFNEKLNLYLQITNLSGSKNDLMLRINSNSTTDYIKLQNINTGINDIDIRVNLTNNTTMVKIDLATKFDLFVIDSFDLLSYWLNKLILNVKYLIDLVIIFSSYLGLFFQEILTFFKKLSQGFISLIFKIKKYLPLFRNIE